MLPKNWMNFAKKNKLIVAVGAILAIIVLAVVIPIILGGPQSAGNLSLTAARQGNSDTFNFSMDFTAVDANGNAMAGAPIFCKFSENVMGADAFSFKRFKSLYDEPAPDAITDSQGKFHYADSFELSSNAWPRISLAMTCYAEKDGVKSSEASDTLEITRQSMTPITRIVLWVPEPTAPFSPGQVFELAGHVFYDNGIPARDANVFIDFQGDIYRMGVDNSGAFSYKIKMPSTGGIYNVKLAAEGLQNKRAETVVNVTVS